MNTQRPFACLLGTPTELVVRNTEIPSRLTAVPDDNGVSRGQGTCTYIIHIREHIIIYTCTLASLINV